MKFFLLFTSVYLTFFPSSLLVIAHEPTEIAPKIAQSHTPQGQESLIDFRASSGISVSIPTQEYLDLIDGKISQLLTQNYLIRRRLGSRPVAYQADRTKLFNLYFDVYDQQGELLGTKLHNQNKPRLSPFD